MADDRVDVKFGAQTGELKNGVDEAKDAVQSSTKRMSESFKAMSAQITGSMNEVHAAVSGGVERIGAAFEKVNSIFLAATAVLAGGKMFKDAVKETVAMNVEAMKLATTMGITTETASGLISALDHIGVSTEQFTGATKMLGRGLATNEKAFNDLGVETRDSSYHFRDMTGIMLDVNKALAGIAEGTDREIAGKKLYGRSWDEVRKIIKLTAEEMEHGKERAKELGLEVGPEKAAQTAEYKLQMRELHQTFSAIGKVVGDAVLPMLTAMGQWFNEIGPTVVNVFRAAVNTLISALDLMGLAIVTLWDIAKGVFMSIGTLVGSVAIAIKQAATGHFKDAAATMGSIGETVKGVWIGVTDDIEQHTKNAADRMQKRWGMIAPAKSVPKTGGNRITGDEGKKDEKSENQVAVWREELEKRKEAEKDFFKESTDADLAFWQAKLATLTGSSKEEVKNRTEVGHIIFGLEQKMAIDTLQAQIQGFKAQSDAAMKGSKERIQIATGEAVWIKKHYGEGSKEYAAAQREIQKMQLEYADDQIKRAEMVFEKEKELGDLSLGEEKQRIEYLKNIGAINAQQEIAALQNIENQKYAIEVNALQQKIAATKQGSIEEQKALNDLEVLEKKHNGTMLGLSLKGSQEQLSTWNNAFDSIAGSFNQSVTKMITAGGTLQDFMKSMATSILNTFIDIGLKWVEQLLWQSIVTKTTNVDLAASLAALYAVAAMSSVATIPGVGWAMAPGVGSAAYAEGMGYSAMASASQGYDIPAGINPVTQLHASEMVLPKEYANVIRGMANGGGSSGGGDIHFNVSAIDAGGVANFFRANGKAIAAAVRQQSRNFNPAVS